MKRLIPLTLILLSIVGFMTPIHAKESEIIPEDSYLDSVYEAVPEEVLPFVEKEYTSESFTSESLLSIAEVFLKRISDAFLTSFAELLVYLILIVILKRVCDCFMKESLISTWISGLILMSALSNRILLLADATASFCESVRTFTATVSMTLGGIIALGGNTASSVAITASVSSISYLLETLCIKLLLPTVILILVTLIGGAVSQGGVHSLGKVARSFYQWTIGAVSFLSVTVLTYQSVIAQAEDTLAARTVRFALSGSVPIVGGAVGESLGTLIASVKMIRASAGVLCVVTVLILALIPLSSLISFRFAVYLTEELAGMLNLTEEGILLGETRKLINMMIAVTVLVGILFIFVLSLYMTLPLAYA